MGLLPFHKLTPGYMPWGGAAGQNIEHPRTLAILCSFFCVECILVFFFVFFFGKVQFRWATMSCNSSYYVLLMVRKFSQRYFIIFMTYDLRSAAWSLFKNMLCACANHDHINHAMRKRVSCPMRTTRCKSELHIYQVWSASLLFTA